MYRQNKRSSKAKYTFVSTDILVDPIAVIVFIVYFFLPVLRKDIPSNIPLCVNSVQTMMRTLDVNRGTNKLYQCSEEK